MLLGYNTNGFAHHRLEDALTLLAEMGYRSIALTLDHHFLNPYDPDFRSQLRTVQAILEKHELRTVIETGARYLLDPEQKHQPTLMSSPELAQRRLDFLCRSVDVAQQLGSDAVSFWSGTVVEDCPNSELWDRLIKGCHQLCDYAEPRGVKLAFEPEPGMFIDTMNRYAMLSDSVNRDIFGLTLDIGHLQCQGDLPIEEHFPLWQEVLWNVHIEDMVTGMHDHLFFGEGEIDFPSVMSGLKEIEYCGGIHVELSRHSHRAVETARESFQFLNSLL